jgi:hypothetical protein
MAASFRPRVPATTDEHAFRDTGMMFAADATRRSYRRVRFGSMLSKKSFGGNKRNFLKLLMRFVRSDVRVHIASQKNDHGPSYRTLKSIATAE